MCFGIFAVALIVPPCNCCVGIPQKYTHFHAHILLSGSSYAIPMMMNIVSTFSMLMAELRATNGREHAIDVKSRFLPHCKTVTGARHQPHEVYNGVDYQCGDSKQIMLPIECPYWNRTSLPAWATAEPFPFRGIA